MKKLFVLIFPVFSLAVLAQKPSGKIALSKGQQFVIESASDATITQEMMGQSMEMKMGTSTKLSADVKDNKENNYVITQTLTNVKSTFSGMGQEKAFDSDKKEDMDGEMGILYKGKVNAPKDIVISNEGKSMEKKDSTIKDTADANPMASIMDMMGTGQDNISGALFLVIPAGKKAGETWQDSTSKEGLKLKRTFTLNSISGKDASVTISSVLDVNKTMQVQGMDMNTVMTSKTTSAVLVDVASNIQKENKSTMDLSGTIDVMGQSVPITAKGTTVTTVKAK